MSLTPGQLESPRTIGAGLLMCAQVDGDGRRRTSDAWLGRVAPDSMQWAT